jgi:hypothetical protein
MDDNVFLIALNHRLSLSSSKSSMSLKQIGIIDPLFMHALNASSGPIADMLLKSFQNHQPNKLFSDPVATHLADHSGSDISDLWGFFRSVENRLKLSSIQDRVEILLLPIFHAGCWGVIILGGLSQSPQSQSQSQSQSEAAKGQPTTRPYALLYFPLLKHFKEKTVEIMDYLRNQLSVIIRMIHPNNIIRSDYIILINASNPFADSGLDETAAFLEMFKNSGVEVIMFIELAKQMIGDILLSKSGPGVVTEDALMKFARQTRQALVKENIVKERQKIIQTLSSLSEKQLSQLKEYLHRQSKDKY